MKPLRGGRSFRNNPTRFWGDAPFTLRPRWLMLQGDIITERCLTCKRMLFPAVPGPGLKCINFNCPQYEAPAKRDPVQKRKHDVSAFVIDHIRKRDARAYGGDCPIRLHGHQYNGETPPRSRFNPTKKDWQGRDTAHELNEFDRQQAYGTWLLSRDPIDMTEQLFVTGGKIGGPEGGNTRKSRSLNRNELLDLDISSYRYDYHQHDLNKSSVFRGEPDPLYREMTQEERDSIIDDIMNANTKEEPL